MSEIFTEITRILMLIALPLVLFTFSASLIVSFFQRFIRTDDSVISFTAKFLVAILTLTFTLPSTVESLQTLMVLCIQNIQG
jgi:flagellar biosynthesis protein FliQ